MALTIADGAEGAAHAAKSRVTRRRFLTGAFGLAGLSASATGAYAGVIEPLSLVVTRYALNPPGWPAGRKLSIAVIADLHAGGPDMTLAHIRHVIETANALQPELVVLLGDYKARYRFKTEPVADPIWADQLARLKAPLGIWAILGNHDWWYDLAGVRGALAQVGIPVLENDAVLVGPAEQKFWLAGLGDQLAHRIGHGKFHGVDDLPGTLAHVTTDDPVLLLVHEPDIFTEVPQRVALTLAGHTHGGQIRLPIVWPHFVPSKYGARFAYGHIIEDGRHMIVSGGLGTSIVPARFGVPPEIVHVTLGA
jgi:predicted MPP superfamily phosphohydrolase